MLGDRNGGLLGRKPGRGGVKKALRRYLDAESVLTKRDRVQIEFQDLFFGVQQFDPASHENLPELVDENGKRPERERFPGVQVLCQLLT